MQHTQHSHEVPLSADAILDNYLWQQQQQQNKDKLITTLKRNGSSGGGQTTAFKFQVPSPASLLAASLTSSANAMTTSKPLKKSTYQQQQALTNHQRLLNSSESEAYCRGLANDSLDEQEEGDSRRIDTTTSGSSSTHGIAHVQRKLLVFFYIYVTIIITLYLFYAAYCYHAQSSLKRQQQQIFESTSTTPEPAVGSGVASSLHATSSSDDQQALQLLQAKMDDKLRLLERYIDVLALDLEDTKARLREREKCACSIGCSFNGTRYADGQQWRSADNKCDICACRAGKISCAPRECPKLSSGCESAVQLPGQCCPTCMKKCKLNQTLVAHGHTFTQPSKSPTKQCKCYDGLIKCEPIGTPQDKHSKTSASSKSKQQQQHAAAAKNKTLEYLSSILSSPHAQEQIRFAAAASNSAAAAVK